MSANVEIKACIRNVDRMKARIESCACGPPCVVRQEDVFFNVPSGRLKLRIPSMGASELIFYERPDIRGPRTSQYWTTPVSDPSALRNALKRALGIRNVVYKMRLLYMHGKTRIHLDFVDGLGVFTELEVVLTRGESEANGRREAEELCRRLEIAPEDFIAGAYVDLLEAKARQGGDREVAPLCMDRKAKSANRR
jgi:predicted adenylyl cyclase CyaB